MTKSTTDAVIVLVTGTIVLLLMALFGVSFILYYHRRQRQSLREKQELQQTFQRELLQTQIETQNQTLLQVAEELHDHIGQLLTVVKMRLNGLEDEQLHPETRHAIEQARELVGTIITDVRSMVKTLDHNAVERFGLLPSLTLELQRIERMGRVRAQLLTSGEPYALEKQAEIVLMRMAQESLNNALKHSHARLLTVTVDYQASTFVLSVADDGQGFDPHYVAKRPAEQAGLGLSNLQRRAELLGGTCLIQSRPGQGTRVAIQIPRKYTV